MSGFVYFIRPVGMPGPVKIGCSEAPAARLDGLMAWSPLPLEIVAMVPGGYDLERNIHECLSDLYSHKEWFRADPRLDALIAALQAGKPIEEAMDLNGPRTPLRKLQRPMDDHPMNKMRRSYSMKLRWAERRADTGTHYFILSGDDNAILVRWRGYGHGYKTAPISPTPAELARLDAIIADPRAHLVPHARQRAA
jgi:hypothetical protein